MHLSNINRVKQIQLHINELETVAISLDRKQWRCASVHRQKDPLIWGRGRSFELFANIGKYKTPTQIR